MMKTDVLFSSPRLRFSRAQQEAILAWGKDLGARDVPSLYGVEKFQREALESLGNPTVKVTATSGNVYYRNTIRDTIAKDYAHPDTRREIHCHPQLVQTKAVSQAWHSKKWLVDAPDFLLTPMVRLKGKDFYVDELVHCADGRWFIPTRFFEMEDRALWAVGYVVERRAHVVCHQLVLHSVGHPIECPHFVHCRTVYSSRTQRRSWRVKIFNPIGLT
ncbi:uncharacterized protein C8Q71DRAFT_714938 [Rhodofomes roseus]|uniref:Uncharacterized protein n=1 Tax=Rhodofomes roseus TaxID=34475 RepID=A0ABQ8K5Y1_9APHY|nr:uncharacterized protein C8Q71DRAFT_714938 [Rhodofomes roseus]KAH9831855.1 hypothetical protein C8Q71DRAFT_714938 [Rhodofomes roseus]